MFRTTCSGLWLVFNAKDQNHLLENSLKHSRSLCCNAVIGWSCGWDRKTAAISRGPWLTVVPMHPYQANARNNTHMSSDLCHFLWLKEEICWRETVYLPGAPSAAFWRPVARVSSRHAVLPFSSACRQWPARWALEWFALVRSLEFEFSRREKPEKT